MKNAIVRLGFCLLFILTAATAFAVGPTTTVTRIGTPTQRPSDGKVKFKVTFSADVTGFGDASFFVLSGTGATGGTSALTNTIDARNYEVTVSGLTVTGTVQLHINSGAAMAGPDPNQASSSEETITFDSDPEVTVTPPGSGHSRSLVFVVAFDEVVTGFDATAISFTGSGANMGSLSVGTINATTPGKVFNVTINVPTAGRQGEDVKVSVLANHAKDAANNNNKASAAPGTITFTGVAPSVTVTSVVPGEDTFTIYGEVTDDGGFTNVERGTVWKAGSSAGSGDHKQQSGTGSGIFNDTRNESAINPETLYFVSTYADNAVDPIVLATPQLQVWTLSQDPDDKSDVTLTNVTSTSIDVAFQKFGTIGNTDGMVILRKSGSAITAADLPNGKAPTIGNLPLLIELVTNSNQTNLTTNPDPGLTPGTTYYYAAVPFNWDGSHPETYHYYSGFTQQSATTISASSRIKINSAPATIPYINETGTGVIGSSSDGIIIADMTVVDGDGTNPDADGLPTNIKTLTINVENPTMINHIAILDGTILDEGVLDMSGNITFDVSSGSLNTLDDNAASASSPDQFYIIASFNSTNVDEGARIKVTVTGVTVYSGSSETLNGNGGNENTGAAKNIIEVTATKMEFSNITAAINPNANFGLTVTALDANNRVDKNLGGTVELSKTAGNGTLSSTDTPGGLIRALTNGVATWSQLQFDEAQPKTVLAHHNSSSSLDKSTIIDVISLGATISNTTLNLCYNTSVDTDITTFRTLTITITESDKTDLSIGDDQSLALTLPPGFIFHTATASTVVATHPSSPGSDITATAHLNYIGKNTLRFKYSVGTNTNKDVITITAKVKYTDQVPTAGGIIERVGGTAVIAGSADGDGTAFGTLTASSGSQGVDFKNTNGGAIGEQQTTFSKTDPAISLKGTKAGDLTQELLGVFSGDGITLDAGNYKFNPSLIDNGSHDITFAYTNTGTDASFGNQVGCISTKTKSLIVFSSIITGLNQEYCVNGTPSTLGAPLTTAPGGCYSSNYRYQYYEYDLFQYIDMPNQTTFDPSDPAFTNEIANFGGLYIAVAYEYICALPPYPYYAYYGSFVRIYNKPDITFAPSLPNGICSYDVAQDLVGSVFNTTEFDRFWVSEVGDPLNEIPAGTSGTRAANNFKFIPSGANPTGSDKSVQINFQHKDPTTKCTNEVAQVVGVWRKPPTVPASKVYVDGVQDISAEFCQTDGIKAFDINSPPATSWYKWYNAAGTTPTLAEGNSFLPGPGSLPGTVNGTSFVPNVGTTTFNVSQTEHRVTNIFGVQVFGCESDKMPITVEIFGPPVAKLIPNPSSPVICEGKELVLLALGAAVTPAGLGGKWKSLATTPGTFKAGSTITDDYTDTGGALTYKPDNSEYTDRVVNIQLWSNDPAGPCGIVKSEIIKVSVNPGVSISFPQNPARFCADAPISVEGRVTNGVGSTWSINPGNGNGTLDPATITDRSFVTYLPNVTELNQGGTIKLDLTANDPDGNGPCDALTETVNVILDQPARIDAGSDINFCAGDPIVLNGSKPLNQSSATSWTWTTNGAAGDAGIVDQNALVTQYNPSASENPGPQALPGSSQITFTLASNAPIGSACSGQFDDVVITIHYKPTPVVIDPPRSYCQGESVDFLRANPIANALVTWYDDDPAVDPLSSVFTGPNFSTGVASDVEKKVPFWATQTFDKFGAFAGCESDASTASVVINPKPVPFFTAENFCLGDIMKFHDNSTVPQRPLGDPDGPRTITGWVWDFDDNLGLTPQGGVGVSIPAGTQDGRTAGTFDQPEHSFKSIGFYNVEMTVYTSDNCSATYRRWNNTLNQPDPWEVGAVPDADFEATKLCLDDLTKFTYTGTEGAIITDWAWDFKDPSTAPNDLSTSAVPTHKFSDFGDYMVELAVKTALECHDEVTRKVSIYPYIKTFPYIEDFETNRHGWVAEGKTIDGGIETVQTSWSLLTAAGSITSDDHANVGPTFWATHTNTGSDNLYYSNERSVLYTPCVDMTVLPRPVLALDYAMDTEPNADGAYFEYKVEDANGIGEWKRLGDIGDGFNWYNKSSVSGLSLLGGIGQDVSQFGWTSNDVNDEPEWTTGRLSLDQLVGNQRVRFRLVFGSNTSPVNANVFDGFALDYFKIEPRNRLVLVESFTSRSSLDAIIENRDEFIAFPRDAVSDKVLKIEYHTGLPAQAGDPKDPIFAQNPMDPNARASFYGLSAVPRAYIDGYTSVTGSGGLDAPWSYDYYNTESLKNSPISIVVNKPDITNGVMTVTGTVTANENALPANTYSLYIAVVENEVTADEDTYVLRKMLPNASGTKVPATPLGTSFEFTQTWSIDRSYLSDDPDLTVIAFVQSDIINEDMERPILQAAYNDDIDNITFTTGIEIPFLEQTAMYPNPSDKMVNIELPQATASGVDVSVIDQLGRAVIKSSIGIGQKSTTINTAELAGAVYIVQMKENGVYTTKRLLVTHSHK